MKNQPTLDYPSLTKSYKGIFPFKICTTSFIYPDHYIPNVKMLGPYMDEIELLLFESQAVDSIPSNAVIAELGHLGREFDLSYNVHLPTDVSLTDLDPAQQKTVKQFMKEAQIKVNKASDAQVRHLVEYCNSLYNETS